jgi:UDP-N-acetylglucosamine 2-epimerase (non-hydrolysing)
MDEGVLIMSDLEPESVLESVSIIHKQHNDETAEFNIVKDYDLNNVSKKVIRLIHSYTGYVNRTVWKK